jgi:hypothetical protein
MLIDFLSTNQGFIMKPNTSKILQRILIAWVIAGTLLSAFFLYQGYTARQQQALAQARLDQLVHVLNGTEPAQPSQTHVEPAQSESVVEDVFGFLIELVLIVALVVGLIKLSNRKSLYKAPPKPQIMRDTKNDVSPLGLLSTAVMVIFLIRCQMQEYEGKPANQPKALQSYEALTMCQFAIKRLSRDPDTAEIPYVDNLGGSVGTEYYFAWGAGTKYARMRNGLGLEVPVSASCIVDATTKKITQLIFDGKTII